MYVLDTNTLIYFFKGIGSVSSFLLNTPPNRIGIPTVVLYELEVGIAKSVSPEKRISQLAALTSIVNILPFGIDEVRYAALLKAIIGIQPNRFLFDHIDELPAFFPHILPLFHRIYEDIRGTGNVSKFQASGRFSKGIEES
jgi:predicted nucleic acid-binding protein